MTTPPPPGMPSMPQDPNGPSDDDKTMALIAHVGIIFGFLVPLIIYLIKGDKPWVKAEAAKAFNFVILINIAMIAIWIINLITGFIDLGFLGAIFACVFCLVPLGLWVAQIVFGIMNGVRTSNGEPTSYPFEIPILK